MPKKCTNCGEEKPLSHFYNRKGKKTTGKNSHCKICEHKQIYEWRKNNPDKQKEIQRRANLKRSFGISVEQYNELLEKQNNCCAICQRHESEFPVRLAVDHDHKTRRIRGLLCVRCNRYEVGRNTIETASKLRKIADYLEQGTDWFVPKKKRPKKRKPV